MMQTEKLFLFKSGYPTTEGTVRLLAEAVRAYSANARIRRRAREITAHLPSMDTDGEIEAVWDFIMGNVRYMRDPIGIEYVTSPASLDAQVDEGTAQEDCEGVALYAATLLASMGIPSEFEIQGRRPNEPKRFSHCALRVQNPRTKQWISFDPIGAWEFPGQFGLGDSLHTEGDPIEHWNMEGERMDGLLGLFLGDSYDDAQKAAPAVNAIAQGASAFGPYGAIFGALAQGGMAIAQSQIKPSAKPQPIGQSSPTPVKSSTGKPGVSRYLNPRYTTLITPTDEKKKTNAGTVAAVAIGALVGTKLLGVW